MEVPEGYAILGDLGAGGFGRVYRATSPAGREVALKVMRVPRGAASSEGLLRLQNEIELLKRARCPQVVEVFDYGLVGEETFFISMEVVRGKTLRDHLAATGTLPVPMAVSILAEAANAVARLHDVNVLHRDLKPENILLDDPYRPDLKLVDFGVSLLSDTGHGRGRGTLAGTLGYMAPECFAAHGVSDASLGRTVDMFAMGVIFYEMLTGIRPFDATTPSEFVAQTALRAADPPSKYAPDVPEIIDRICLALLTREPSERYQLASCVRDDLKRAGVAMRDGREREGFQLQLHDARRARLFQAPIFGRQAELRTLGATLRNVRKQRRGEIVLLGGPAGVGKSRVAGELRRAAHADGCLLVGTGRCRQDIDLLPYAPLREALGELIRAVPYLGVEIDVLRERFGRLSGVEWRALSAMVPELAELFSAGEPPVSAELAHVDVGAPRPADAPAPLRDHALLADGILRLARALAPLDGKEPPVVFLLEDAHWAEPSTRSVLQALAPRIAGVPLLFVATYRSEEIDPHLLLGQDATGEPPPHTALALPPLAPEDNRAMLAWLVGDDPAAADRLLEAIPLLREGVPLFNVELLKLLVGEGLGTDAAGARLGDFEIPDSISRVLLRSINALEVEHRDILSLAALVGRSFVFDELTAVPNAAPQVIVESLDSALARNFCRKTPAGYAFVHESIRQAFIDRLGATEQTELHRLIAHALAGDPRRGPAYLAHHLERGGQAVEAARRYLESAGQATAAHDPERARDHLERALRLIGDRLDAPSVRALYIDVTTRLVAVASHFGQLGPLAAHLEQCEALLSAPDHGVPPEIASALYAAFAKLHYVAGNSAKTLVYSQLAMEAGSSHRMAAELQTVPMNILGRNFGAYGRFSDAISYLEVGIHLLEEPSAGPSAPAELSHSMGVLACAYAYTGLSALADHYAARSLEIARAISDPVRTMGALFYHGAVAEARGDWRAGLEGMSALFRMCETSGLGGHYLYLGSVFAGRLHYFLGHMDRASYLLKNGIALSGKLGAKMGLGWANGYLGDVLAATGRWAEAREAFQRATDMATEMGDLHGEALGYIGLAKVAARVDRDPARALSHFRNGARVLKRGGNNTVLQRALSSIGPLLTQLGDAENGARATADGEALRKALGLPAEADPASTTTMAPSSAKLPVYEAIWASTRLMQTMASDTPQMSDEGKVKSK